MDFVYFRAAAGESFITTPILTPCYSSGGRVLAVDELTEAKVRAYVGLFHSGGRQTGDLVALYPDGVEILPGGGYSAGVSYYLGLAGPVERSEVPAESWTVRVGVGTSAGGLLLSRGSPESTITPSSGAAFE
jgi:hypothetical protein